MVDDDDRHKLGHIVDRAKDAVPDTKAYRRRKIGSYVLVAVAAASLVFGVSNLFDSQQEAVAGQVSAKADSVKNSNAATSLANEIIQGCLAGGQTTKVLTNQGLCSSAAETKTVVGEPGRAGVNGSRGPPGPEGSPGANGTNGTNGVGQAGPNGAPGANATGIAGTNGTNGTNGTDGQNGADGKDGTNGVDGKDAYPFSFTFTIPGTLGDQTYTCTVLTPADPGTCTQQ